MNSFRLKSNSTWEQLILLFSFSMAIGNFNPFADINNEENVGFGLSQLIVIVLIPYLLIKYYSKRTRGVYFNGWQKYLVSFFIIIFLVSFFFAHTIDNSFIIYWVKIFLGILLCLYLPKAFSTPMLLERSFFVYSISCIFVSVLILLGFLDHYISVHNGRMWLWGENPNTSSGRWVVAILLLIYIVLKNPLGYGNKRFFMLFGIVPLLLCIIMSGSRGSLLIAIICIFIYLLRLTKKHMFMIVFYGLLVSIPLYYSVVLVFSSGDYTIMERIYEAINEGGNEAREELLLSAIDIFIKNPLFGVGYQDFMPIMVRQYQMDVTVHNLFAYILAISGIVGFIPFVLFIIKLIKGTLKVVNVNILPLLLLIFMLFIASKSGGILGYLYMWFMYSWIVASINNATRELRASQASPEYMNKMAHPQIG